jgi:hypothetical protein
MKKLEIRKEKAWAKGGLESVLYHNHLQPLSSYSRKKYLGEKWCPLRNRREWNRVCGGVFWHLKDSFTLKNISSLRTCINSRHRWVLAL